MGMESALLIKEALDLGLEIAKDLPPGVAGACDFIEAVKARSMYGMLTSAFEFFLDFAPGGKFLHVIEKAPKLLTKIKRLEAILRELAEGWGISLRECREFERAATHASHSPFGQFCAGLHLPPGFCRDRWVGSTLSLSGKTTGKFYVREVEGLAVEAIKEISEVEMVQLRHVAEKVAADLATRTTATHMTEILMKFKKAKVKVHLYVRQDGTVVLVFSAPGTADVPLPLSGGLSSVVHYNPLVFKECAQNALRHMHI